MKFRRIFLNFQKRRSVMRGTRTSLLTDCPCPRWMEGDKGRMLFISDPRPVFKSLAVASDIASRFIDHRHKRVAGLVCEV